MLYAIRVRLYPNATQRDFFARTFGCCRWVYNEALAHCQALYEAGTPRPSAYDLEKRLPSLKAKHPWLGDADSQALKQACKDLDGAYKNFFRRIKNGETPGFPRFKSKHRGDATYTATAATSITLELRQIKLPKAGWVRCRGARAWEGRIKRATVRQTPTGKYYATILIDDGRELPAQPEAGLTPLGIDVGCKTEGFTHQFAALSTGYIIHAPAEYKWQMKRLRRAQRKLSRKKKGSINRLKQKRRVAQLHERISAVRRDFLHKLTHRLTCENQALAVEDLNVRGMMTKPAPKPDPEKPGIFLPNGASRKRGLNRSLTSASLGEFFRQLEYKCAWRGVALLKVDRWEPSSKRCSSCGEVNTELTLADRRWQCQACGTEHHRDINAAINIAARAA
ncbi:RNA-guided endonuclease InsQ/TnpB family protein [Citrobacter braakii]|uniref:RNA-guided endonuclease InsQ/TnpB family protein n=1 Tax=Citrobacter braakii TaxID=57706 RepID=UPI001A331AB2|nr:transposase [Citrobacter freundii]HAT2362576.1 transposase [Citrobacter freundii]HAU8242756.1 transposase [Citrobacter freundii]HCD1220535.1 transposase [Citrobacter freundii]HCD1225814.1 transposase [Citrobacter freundii]